MTLRPPRAGVRAWILHRVPHDLASTKPCLTFRLIVSLFVEFWPTRESLGMARGLRFWALGVDSGPRGGAFEGILDPPKIIKTTYFYWCPNGAYVEAIQPLMKTARRGPTLRFHGDFEGSL